VRHGQKFRLLIYKDRQGRVKPWERVALKETYKEWPWQGRIEIEMILDRSACLGSTVAVVVPVRLCTVVVLPVPPPRDVYPIRGRSHCSSWMLDATCLSRIVGQWD